MIVGIIVPAIVGLICIVIGISNRKGNISSLHSYHRERVTEEDRPAFGKAVGTGMIIVGVSVIIMGIATLVAMLSDTPAYAIVGMVMMFVGLAVGLVISFRAMIKYNKGIF